MKTTDTSKTKHNAMKAIYAIQKQIGPILQLPGLHEG